MQKSILLAIAFTTFSAAAYAQSDPSISPAPSSTGISAVPSSAYGGDATGSNDPYIRKRAEDRAAKAEYKANKRAAKQQYKAQKEEAKIERDAAVNSGTPQTSGGSD